MTNKKLDANVLQLNIGSNYNTLDYGKFKLTYSNIRETLDTQNTTTSNKIANQLLLSNIYKKSNKLSLIVAATYLDTKESDIKSLLKQMHELGPKIAIITDGPNGANTYDGSEMWHMPMYPDPAPPVDRTGAGDSFSSTFTSMLALGMSVPEALARAPINSMNVVQYIGAQKGLLTMEKLEKFLADAPEDYKATQITLN